MNQTIETGNTQPLLAGLDATVKQQKFEQQPTTVKEAKPQAQTLPIHLIKIATHLEQYTKDLLLPLTSMRVWSIINILLYNWFLGSIGLIFLNKTKIELARRTGDGYKRAKFFFKICERFNAFATIWGTLLVLFLIHCHFSFVKPMWLRLDEPAKIAIWAVLVNTFVRSFTHDCWYLVGLLASNKVEAMLDRRMSKGSKLAKLFYELHDFARFLCISVIFVSKFFMAIDFFYLLVNLNLIHFIPN